MNWVALVEVLWKLFGPVLEAWLKRLFDREGPPLAEGFPVETADAVRQWFAAARARTWRWELRTRARLAICERIALAKTGEIASAMRFGAAAPELTKAEVKQLADAM